MTDLAPAPPDDFDIESPRHIHIVGIGGAGMSAIAILLLSLGHEVSGSDFRESRFTRRLKGLGATVSIGHRAENVSDADAVAISTAVRDTNPEVRAAIDQGTRVLRRSQILALLTRRWRTVAVAGTHGKTTVSSMLAAVLDGAGFDPSYLIGGELNESGSNAHRGTGDILVCEADESDGTFLTLGPAAAIVTNIEPDHLENYGSLENLHAAFRDFLRGVEGPRVVGLDDSGAAGVVAELPDDLDVIGYGLGDVGRYGAEVIETGRGGSTFKLIVDGADAGELRVTLPGLHNVQNALAAAAMAIELGADVKGVRRGLDGYRGVGRRFETRGEPRGITLIDDYAHLPTEVMAAIEAARSGGWDRVVAVFQPHLYSRTATYADAFGRALADADLAFVTDVFAAREDPVPGVTGELVADAVGAADGTAVYVPHRADLATRLAPELRRGDVCLSIGAGDITSLPDELAVELDADRESEPISAAATALAELGVTPQRDMPLAHLTTYRVGGNVSIYVEPESEDELLAVRDVIREFDLAVLVVGRGSNMLVADSGFAGCAVRLGAGFNWIDVDADTGVVRAGAATPLPHLARTTGRRGLTGFEFGAGIPASLGGAVRMNAGGHGSEMVEVLQRVGVVDLESDRNGVETRPASELDLSYRHSSLGVADVVVWAQLQLAEGDVDDINATISEIVRWRKENQPGGLGNAGSVFKNPPGDSAGRLIDAAGCKSFAVGGARVSELHANFIIAESWATAADVLGLMRAVQARVLEAHGVELVPEVRLVGEFDP